MPSSTSARLPTCPPHKHIHTSTHPHAHTPNRTPAAPEHRLAAARLANTRREVHTEREARLTVRSHIPRSRRSGR
eukprot:4864676-Pyramimonas_sp.AAC.1